MPSRVPQDQMIPLWSRGSGSFKHFMNQLKVLEAFGPAFATQAVSFSRHATQSFDTGSGWRDLSRARREQEISFS